MRPSVLSLAAIVLVLQAAPAFAQVKLADAQYGTELNASFVVTRSSDPGSLSYLNYSDDPNNGFLHALVGATADNGNASLQAGSNWYENNGYPATIGDVATSLMYQYMVVSPEDKLATLDLTALASYTGSGVQTVYPMGFSVNASFSVQFLGGNYSASLNGGVPCEFSNPVLGGCGSGGASKSLTGTGQIQVQTNTPYWIQMSLGTTNVDYGMVLAESALDLQLDDASSSTSFARSVSSAGDELVFSPGIVDATGLPAPIGLPSPVPEPGSAGLLAMGLAALAVARGIGRHAGANRAGAEPS